MLEDYKRHGSHQVQGIPQPENGWRPGKKYCVCLPCSYSSLSVFLRCYSRRMQAYVCKKRSVSKLLSPMRNTCGVPGRSMPVCFVQHLNYCGRKTVIERESCGGGAVLSQLPVLSRDSWSECLLQLPPVCFRGLKNAVCVCANRMMQKNSLCPLFLVVFLSLIQTIHVAGPVWDLRTDFFFLSLFILISLLSGFVLAKCGYHILPLTLY